MTMKPLKALNYVISRIIVIILLILLLISGYILWSNYRTYQDADDVYNSLLKLKPEDKMEGIDFGKLKGINSDICGWLTVDGTRIDYPIVQGENNLVYMNRDFYGNSSLSGSIFLDSRNSNSFTDSYSIIYGHHMNNSLMFGDLDLFKDKDFFANNDTAMILTEDRKIEMKVLAVMEVYDSTPQIFNPTMWGSDLTQLAEFIKENSLLINNSSMQKLTSKPTMTQVVSLVTCSSGHTGIRTVLILISERTDKNPDRPYKPDVKIPEKPDTKSPAYTGDSIWNSPKLWLSVLIAGIAVIAIVFGAEHSVKKRREKIKNTD